MSSEMSDSRGLLDCDLVLKGGVASGVVFPSAVAELAKRYRFCSLGGTSAGAIAATVAAAAEFRRQRVRHNHDAAFDEEYGFSLIDGLAGELGRTEAGTRKILSLFQPAPAVAPLFRIALRSIGTASLSAGSPSSRSTSSKILKVIIALFVEFYVCLISVILGTVTIGYYLFYNADNTIGNIINIVTFNTLGLLVIPLAIVVFRLVRMVLCLSKLRYGLCSGRGQRAAGGTEGLSEWMHRLIQDAAGLASQHPLTFGQLWTLGASHTSASTTAKRQIELVLITSNLTQGLSHRLPFIEKSPQQPLYFRRVDLIEMLPDEIVEWMISHPNQGELPLQYDEVRYHRLPAPADLPIVFGARISLSFPILLQAIPLFTIDQTGKRPIRCWFSDGGITSNFPIHLFDAPLPARPTFCINLVRFDPDRRTSVPPQARDQAEILAWSRVCMATTNEGGQRPRFNIFDAKKPTLPGFISAMIDTARENHDNELALLPGYRDRIVDVELDDGEGGLHLDTPPEVIEALSRRGRAAAVLLAARYGGQHRQDPKSGGPIVLDWNNHRWVRLRSVLAAIELTVLQLRLGWQQGDSLGTGSPSYKDLFDQSASLGPFGWTERQARDRASAALVDLSKLAENWDSLWPTFDLGDATPSGYHAPRPKSVLRMSPNGDQDPIAMGFGDR